MHGSAVVTAFIYSHNIHGLEALDWYKLSNFSKEHQTYSQAYVVLLQGLNND